MVGFKSNVGELVTLIMRQKIKGSSFYFQGLVWAEAHLPRMIAGTERMTGLRVHRGTSFVCTRRLGFAEAGVARERIRCVSSGRTKTETVLEAGAAAAVGNSSNFDLEGTEKRCGTLLTPEIFDIPRSMQFCNMACHVSRP
jgi:hypothetical protein